jgi:hypothetical protein
VKIRFLILSSFLLLQCAGEPTGPSGDPATEPAPIVIGAPTMLRVGSETTLTVDASKDSSPAATDGRRRSDIHAMAAVYTWTASAGAISGTGPSVTYAPPAHADTVRIEVKVKQSGATTRQGSATIVVYKQWVVLKADDFRFTPGGPVSAGWRRFLAYAEQRNIRVGIGLIGNEIERADSNYVALVRELARGNRFEFWNHGYDHSVGVTDSSGHVVSEFRGTSYDHQRDHLSRTQELAWRRCGVVLRAFGAPGNAFDSNTERAIDERLDIAVWLFGPSLARKLVLRHSVDIEAPIFYPDDQQFIAKYDSLPDVVTYQIHPKDWDQARLDTFSRVVDFLVQRGVTFTTPSQFLRISCELPTGPRR